MSLTQERINEIALECFNSSSSEYDGDKCLWEWNAVDSYNLFLSRIRDEQEAVAEVAKGNLGNRLMWDTEEAQIDTPVGTKLFTIPPAPQSCDALVEALEYMRKRYAALLKSCGDDYPEDDGAIINGDEAIAKYKGEKK